MWSRGVQLSLVVVALLFAFVLTSIHNRPPVPESAWRFVVRLDEDGSVAWIERDPEGTEVVLGTLPRRGQAVRDETRGALESARRRDRGGSVLRLEAHAEAPWGTVARVVEASVGSSVREVEFVRDGEVRVRLRLVAPDAITEPVELRFQAAPVLHDAHRGVNVMLFEDLVAGGPQPPFSRRHRLALPLPNHDAPVSDAWADRVRVALETERERNGDPLHVVLTCGADSGDSSGRVPYVHAIAVLDAVFRARPASIQVRAPDTRP